MREDYRFPNMLVGMLTRESLKEAFKKKITTQQIMNFLETHSHPICRQSRAVANQKMMLLEQQTNNAAQKKKLMKMKDRENGGIDAAYFEEMKGVNIGNLFGLSKEQGLSSVA